MVDPYRATTKPSWVDYFLDYVDAFGWKLKAAIRYANKHGGMR